MKFISLKRNNSSQDDIAHKSTKPKAKRSLTKRSRNIKARLKRLEQSQVIDQDTWNLQFKI